MKVWMSLDYHWEARIDKIMDNFGSALEKYFEEKSYGDALVEIFIVFTCRPNYLNFKVRKTYDKEKKLLSYDVITDFEKIKSLDESKKKKLVHETLQNSVELIMGYKKKVKDFDFDAFKKDWKKFFWEFEWK